jgi:hypothetical protein
MGPLHLPASALLESSCGQAEARTEQLILTASVQPSFRQADACSRTAPNPNPRTRATPQMLL